jgi:hypothetical protein
MNRYRHGRFKFIYVGIDFADRHDFTAVVVAEDPLYYGTSTPARLPLTLARWRRS